MSISLFGIVTSRLVLSIANFANFSLANLFSNLSPTSDVILHQIIVVFHNSYATGTDKLRIAKITTRSPASIFVLAHKEILFFALHDGSHAINTAPR